MFHRSSHHFTTWNQITAAFLPHFPSLSAVVRPLEDNPPLLHPRMFKSPHYTSSVALSIVSVPSLVLRKLLSPSEFSPSFHRFSPSGLKVMRNWRFNNQNINDRRNSSNSPVPFLRTPQTYFQLCSLAVLPVWGTFIHIIAHNIAKCCIVTPTLYQMMH